MRVRNFGIGLSIGGQFAQRGADLDVKQLHIVRGQVREARRNREQPAAYACQYSTPLVLNSSTINQRAT
jgi:hypothetical protein